MTFKTKPEGSVESLPKADKESRRNAFLRVGARRMQGVLKQLKLLGNLANRSSYDYTEADAAKMSDALRAAVSDLESRFRRSEAAHFEFD